MMKTCVSTYSFGRYTDTLGICGVIDKAAEWGCDGIEFSEEGIFIAVLQFRTIYGIMEKTEQKRLLRQSGCRLYPIREESSCLN